MRYMSIMCTFPEIAYSDAQYKFFDCKSYSAANITELKAETAKVLALSTGRKITSVMYESNKIEMIDFPFPISSAFATQLYINHMDLRGKCKDLTFLKLPITKLVISNCDFEDADIENLCAGLEGNTALETLFVTLFPAKLLTALAKVINTTQIKHARLHGSGDPQGLAALMESVKTNKHLNNLDLCTYGPRFSNLTQLITDSLKDNQTLTSFSYAPGHIFDQPDLDVNELNEFYTLLDKNPALKLNIADNLFTGEARLKMEAEKRMNRGK